LSENEQLKALVDAIKNAKAVPITESAYEGAIEISVADWNRIMELANE
jgi:hypothetical protein